MFTMHPTLLVGPADWDPARMPKEDFLGRITALFAACDPAIARTRFCTIGTCSTWTNQGLRFHVPESRICSCNPRRPLPSRNDCAFWKFS